LAFIHEFADEVEQAILALSGHVIIPLVVTQPVDAANNDSNQGRNIPGASSNNESNASTLMTVSSNQVSDRQPWEEFRP
jgi:hypothetical protein